jgi:hypothetical protein
MGLTKQEKIFFARVALKISETPTLNTESAMRSVLDDDVRILIQYSRLTDQNQKGLAKDLSDLVYKQIRKTAE